MKRDRIVGALVLLLVGIYVAGLGQIELDAWSAEDLVNSRTLPTLLAASAGLLGVLLLVWPESKADGIALTGRQVVHAGVLFACLALFCAAIRWIGFWPACALFLLATLWIEGERRWPALLGIAAGAPLVFWALISVLLGYRVESGVFA